MFLKNNFKYEQSYNVSKQKISVYREKLGVFKEITHCLQLGDHSNFDVINDNKIYCCNESEVGNPHFLSLKPLIPLLCETNQLHHVLSSANLQAKKNYNNKIVFVFLTQPPLYHSCSFIKPPHFTLVDGKIMAEAQNKPIS